MVYQSGQIKNLYSYVGKDTGLFILGGPADSDEAQLFHEQFPGIAIVGVEPNKSFLEYQTKVGFPGALYDTALWNFETIKALYVSGREERGSSLVESGSGLVYDVLTTTLDIIIEKHRPPDKRVVIWMDIERVELVALQGATTALDQKLITAIYMEAYENNVNGLIEFLIPYGFYEQKRFNLRRTSRNPADPRVFDILFSHR
jgi:FkbM family methyltransferase